MALEWHVDEDVGFEMFDEVVVRGCDDEPSRLAEHSPDRGCDADCSSPIECRAEFVSQDRARILVVLGLLECLRERESCFLPFRECASLRDERVRVCEPAHAEQSKAFFDRSAERFDRRLARTARDG